MVVVAAQKAAFERTSARQILSRNGADYWSLMRASWDVGVVAVVVVGEFGSVSGLTLAKTATRRTFLGLVKRRVIPTAHQQIEVKGSGRQWSGQCQPEYMRS